MMKDEHEDWQERRMKMWKMREEMLNSLSEKELRAFIKGYMMGERTVMRHLKSDHGCRSSGCNCGGQCSCENKEQ
jgi:hypothetical protein